MESGRKKLKNKVEQNEKNMFKVHGSAIGTIQLPMIEENRNVETYAKYKRKWGCYKRKPRVPSG